jgi:hypothetical protein
LLAGAAGQALAGATPFDLSGPVLKVTVTRAGVTLPIWRVPALEAGDAVDVRPDFPKGDAAHYVLVLGFLRGATNPPPKQWFYRADGKHARDGIKATVPAGAGQALVFLAPATGGDFKTLVNAVRGRPGAFVHAAQALQQASLDRSRLDAFLQAVRRQTADDPDGLKAVSPMLARSLGVKVKQDCLDKTPQLQAACLAAGEEALVLNDGHSPSMVQTLTTGDSAGVALSMSATPNAGFGYYSPYLAAVMDMAHLLDGLRTARYQYVPALSTGREDELDLVLNTAPSFHNPKSVLVAGLPMVEAAEPPPLEPVDPQGAYCLDRPDLVLPAQGAPLAFSTGFVRNLALRLKDGRGKVVDLPARPSAEKGGLVIDTSRVSGAIPSQDGVLVGDWGFQPFSGPRFHLQSTAAGRWALATADAGALVVGRQDKASLQGGSPACIQSITLKRQGAKPEPVTWTSSVGGVEASLPLSGAGPGPMTLLVNSYGSRAAEAVPLTAYAPAGRVERFTLHAGDSMGVLEGVRLDEVSELKVGGMRLTPLELTSKDGQDRLTLQTDDLAAICKLAPGRRAVGEAILRDGRKVTVQFQVAPPRPEAALISKSLTFGRSRRSVRIDLTDPDELPRNAELTFSVRAQGSTRLTAHSAIEVETADGSTTAVLKAGDGLIVEDPAIAIASLDLADRFGKSAFGGLRFRLTDDAGSGDWRPLGTLVRTPDLTGLDCTAGGASCILAGRELFLIDQISSDPTFAHPVEVPAGFPGQSISVPKPADGLLYVRLHDDPEVINDVSVAPGPSPPENDTEPARIGLEGALP